MVVLALLGLPVALVLAWAFDIGPAGVTRTQRHNYVRPSVIANVYVALGERETALDWLERGVRDRDGMLQFLDRWWWWWEPFRGDPRFERVRHQVGLPSLGG